MPSGRGFTDFRRDVCGAPVLGFTPPLPSVEVLLNTFRISASNTNLPVANQHLRSPMRSVMLLYRVRDPDDSYTSIGFAQILPQKFFF